MKSIRLFYNAKKAVNQKNHCSLFHNFFSPCTQSFYHLVSQSSLLKISMFFKSKTWLTDLSVLNHCLFPVILHVRFQQWQFLTICIRNFDASRSFSMSAYAQHSFFCSWWWQCCIKLDENQFYCSNICVILLTMDHWHIMTLLYGQ